MQKSLAQIKATSGRDITSQVDNNTLVYGETGSGTGGAFNFMTPVNNALANYQSKFSHDFDGENVEKFIENLSIWLRDNIAGTFIGRGAFTGVAYYSCYGSTSSIELTLTVDIGTEKYYCRYVYGVERKIKQLVTKSDLALYTRVCKFEEFGGVPNQVYTMNLSDLANNRAYLVLLTCPYANVSYYMGVIFNGSAIQNLQELTNNFFTVTYENKILSMAMTYGSNNPFTVQIIGV